MHFSIIIPTYNRAKIIEATIRSVLRQTFDNYEIIIVDDGSTDTTADVIKINSSEKIKYFYKQNEERSVARNYGANKAQGNYLIFLDSDDEMLTNHLQNIYTFLKQQNFQPVFICTGYSVVNPNGKVVSAFSKKGVFDKKNLLYGNYLGCSPVVVKADVFRRFQFNPDRKLLVLEDWDLWLRIISELNLYCLPAKTIIIKNHNDRSVLGASPDQLVNRITYFKQHILKNAQLFSYSKLNKNLFLMGIYSYTALHIALTKSRRLLAIKYLLMAIFTHPGILFKKRFGGIIKQLL